ncbi:hypothetical protein [Roseateles terrae]|uniref:Uncharacterized protein n=1 Tax=Roseateles terrae TaxID=431060 RepID=A0ABR6GNV9_9BURK|nr:hypothetical protein [Roseateles terrae]MBB3193800.1 hypothetical protein [Roseateles terrae]OWQ89057.1 hypothetical protein CDN98_00405 [Roseateles terrae]
MHPLHRFVPTAPRAHALTVPPPHHEPVLSIAECRAVLEMETQTGKRMRSLVSFLNSNDPGAVMPEPERERFLARCEQFTDCTYMEDRWPSVGTGALRYPADEPPPLFSPRHQQMARQRAAVMDQLAADIGSASTSLLTRRCAPLEASLAELQNLIVQLMTDTQPTLCAQLESTLSAIAKRPVPTDGTGCRIAGEVNRLQKFGLDPLGPTIEALKTLRGLSKGNGARPFTRFTQPAYFNKWDRALRAVEREDWAKFERQAKELRQLHAELVPPTVPPRPQPSPQQSPPPVPPRPQPMPRSQRPIASVDPIPRSHGLPAFQRELADTKPPGSHLPSPSWHWSYSPMPEEDLPSGLISPGGMPE